MFRIQRWTSRFHGQSAVQSVDQFANVSGPVVLFQQLENVIGHGFGGFAGITAYLYHALGYDFPNIVFTFPERRQFDHEGPDAKQQVPAKSAPFSFRVQIPVGGADQSEIAGNFLLAAPPGRNLFSCNTRNRDFCMFMGSSPISSKNSVPPSALRTKPVLVESAPVNAPRTWPNRMLSARFWGKEAQSTTTKGFPALARSGE